MRDSGKMLTLREKYVYIKKDGEHISGIWFLMHDGTILQKMGQLCLVRTEMISRGLKRMFP